MTVLYILLGIIAFFVILLSVRFTLELDYKDEFVFKVKWLFITLQLLPENEKLKSKLAKLKEKFKKKEKPKKEEPPPDTTDAAPTPKKENIFASFYRNQGFSGVMQLLRDTVNAINGMFGSIFRHFIFRELYLFVTIGSGDSAATAVDYGKTCAAVFPAMGLICSTAKVKKYDCGVMPDFIHNKKKAVFRTVISFRPIFIINALIVVAFKLFFKVVLKLLKNKPKPQKDVAKTEKPQNDVNNCKEDIKQ